MDDDEAHALGAVHELSWFNTLGEFTLVSDLVLTDDYWKCFCDHDNLVKVEFSSESTFSTPYWGQGGTFNLQRHSCHAGCYGESTDDGCDECADGVDDDTPVFFGYFHNGWKLKASPPAPPQ